MRLFLFILLLLWSFPVWASVQFDSDDNGVIDAQYLLLIQADCSGETETGIFCLDSDDGKLYYYDGDSVEEVGTGSGGSGTVDTTGTVNANEIPYFSDSDTLAAYTEAEFKTAYNIEANTDFIDYTDPVLGADLDVNGNEIQSSSDIDLQLGDAAGTYSFNIQDSDSSDVFVIDSDGRINPSSSPCIAGYDSDAAGADLADEYAGSLCFDLTDTTEDAEYGDILERAQISGSNTLIRHFDASAGYSQYYRPIQAPWNMTSLSPSTTLTDDLFMGHTYYVTTAGTVTLPAVSEYAHTANAYGVICNMSSGVVDVDTNASDLMNLNGTALDDGDKAESDGGGECIMLWYMDATGWYGLGVAYTDGGP